MRNTNKRAIAIVGIGAIMPDAPDAGTFWKNIKDGKYSITEVPEDRWQLKKYYDPDPKAPAKSYTKIGGWIRSFDWDPIKWKMPIPPKVGDMMDYTQKWAIMGTREALSDYGYPNRPLNQERTAVIMGNAMGGDIHLYSAARILYPEVEEELVKAKSFNSLSADLRNKIIEDLRSGVAGHFSPITEDTMPGELGNIVAGRIAALWDFKGPNYIADAACASAMAGMSSAIEGLANHYYDAVITGGVDANMSASTYIKFCKIGALSATGTRPYADGADGFVMGEGGAVFLLKRLSDAERDGDKIYAVIRGIGGSSDGKGKGITAPNPNGQKFAVERGWANAGISPTDASMIEGHGTSTKVGDAAELAALEMVFSQYNLKPGSIALGSVKSNIGHLKGAAGAAGIFKAAMSLYEKVLPPSLNFKKPNPNIDFSKSAFAVNTQLRPWELNGHDIRRVGVSAFGFGGTNFHTVLEEYIPGRIQQEIDREEKTTIAVGNIPTQVSAATKAPLQGALLIGRDSEQAIIEELKMVLSKAKAGQAPKPAAPKKSDLQAAVRLAIDYQDAAELADKAQRAIDILESGQSKRWRALQAKGVFLGKGPKSKIAFLFPGQGSQYVNMLKTLGQHEATVAQAFNEADATMKPLLGKPLTDYIYVDEKEEPLAEAEEHLKQTEITQPAVLATNTALTRLFADYGIEPDMVMGHSLGEYSALVSSKILSYENALKGVSARGTEMAKVSVKDNGLMAAVLGSIDDIEKILAIIKGYVVIANINSTKQAVIGGETKAVKDAVKAFKDAGINAQIIPVSHAFHTKIIASASGPVKRVLTQMGVSAPTVPIISNVTGEFYPKDNPKIKDEIVDLLSRQIASPVQFVKGLNTLYDAGARVFLEVGPKRALSGFVQDVLGDKEDVLSLSSNLPKNGDIVSFNRALCGLFAAGYGNGQEEVEQPEPHQKASETIKPSSTPVAALQQPIQPRPSNPMLPPPTTPLSGDRYQQLGHLFADFLDKGMSIYSGQQATQKLEDTCITGAALGLPGVEKVFDDQNLARILNGEQFIKPIINKLRHEMADKNITRLVKSDSGGPRFETIDNIAEVIKLAGRSNQKDIVDDFGYPEDRLSALDSVTILAIGAGLDAMRDAGIPLQRHYKTTSTGSQLPDRWLLPESMRDDTGIIMASAFPGFNSFADEARRFYNHQQKVKTLEELNKLRDSLAGSNGNTGASLDEIDNRIQALEDEIHKEPYNFDRRFLFKVLSMGHSQFAEYIGARGPNTQINSACASTTQAVSIANDWIQAGRCKRVIVISADDISTDNLMGWFGAGFLATGAAATDEVVENAAIPFDRRRHGMIIGMGCASLVVESKSAAAARGISPIADLLSTFTANSAFHGTRLDVDHIKNVMENLVSAAEKRWGIDRYQMAPQTVFISHETYTPARGGSAAAEINALRYVFGPTADQIVIANTKGLTGHAMAAGIEDVLAVKTIETGIVPPIANFKEIDPELGALNLSKGGHYPVHYALRLGAGFGSQISMSLVRWVPAADGEHRSPQELGYTYRITDHNIWNNWMKQISGSEQPELEVVKRTLRIKDQGPAAITASAQTKQKEHPPIAPQPVAQPIAAPAVVPEVQPAIQKVSDPVQQRVMKLIAEKTGYPTDMLDLDLDMEADLGIDTVKQAEMFAAIREEYGIERDDNIKLRDFPTIGHTIQFVYDHKPELKQVAQETLSHPAATAQPIPAESTPVKSGDAVVERVMALISEKTGYPTDMLDMDLDLEADLGIDTVKQAEMFASVREEYGIERDDSVQLRDYNTLASVVQFVYDKRPDLEKAKPAEPASQTQPTTAEVPDAGPSKADQPGSAVQHRVLQLIAEKTGYPPDMLDLDLDLEADLGIDTVKQAEMFASVREEYGIERDDNVQLRDYNTLASVIQFVYEKRPELQQAAPLVSTPVVQETPQTTAQPPVANATGNDEVTEKVLSLISEKTGYPKDMLDLDLDLEADLGIDTVKQAEMFASVREEYGIERDDNVQLRDYNTLSSVVQFVYDKRPELQKSKPVQPPQQSSESSASGEPATETKATDDAVTQKVLELISEKTGYPSDMLDLDLDLEADLGIDTVKQAEMFASVREEYSIERDDSVQLREYNTLSSVIQFVYDKRPDLQGKAESTGTTDKHPQDQTPATASVVPVLSGTIEDANTIPRRVPKPVLRPELNLCKSTGVKLQKGSRVIIMPDQAGISKVLTDNLKKLNVETLLIEGIPSQDELTKQISKWLEKGDISGVYWLPALDKEKDISKMTSDEWHQATHIRIKLLYSTMRTLYDQVGKAGTFLVSATRLGGKHGYDKEGAYAPLGGAVTGFTKTYKREKPDCLVKVVDFEKNAKAETQTKSLIAETLNDNGAVEIGYKDDARWTITLAEQNEPGKGAGIELNKDTVFLVTGAAGSIVSAITADLAKASSGIFYLLDLAPKPDPNDSDLQRFSNDKENLKKDIFQRLKDSGKKATPVMVEKELTNLERMNSALMGIQAVEQAGGIAHYHSLNLLDQKAVDKVIKEIKKNHGKIDVLLHAGGLEISKTLPDKEPSEFDLVFDVKSDGWFYMLSSIADMPLGATVVFSSIAGRFGNAGQADYSSANDLLCKSISSFRSTRKETRGIALDWTAWGGIGMAVRGSIPQIMKQAGIDMLPPEAGIPMIRRELTSGDNRGEFVVAKSLGLMTREFDENGGLDPAKCVTDGTIMTEKVSANGLYSGLTVQTELDPKKQPFLFDHQIGDTPVLPGVMGVEAMSEAAQLLFPGMYISSIEDVNFQSPFKFYKNEPRTVTVNVTYQKEKSKIIAECRLTGSRKLHGQEEEQITTHFTARIILQKSAPKAVKVTAPAKAGTKKIASKDIYKLYFHGPAYQVLDVSWKTGKNVLGLLNKDLPANHIPETQKTIAMPRLIELCFQTAGIVEMGAKSKMGLPSQIAQLSIYNNIDEKKKTLTAVVNEVKDDAFNAKVVDSTGNVYLELKGYKTMQLPDPIDDKLLKPLTIIK